MVPRPSSELLLFPDIVYAPQKKDWLIAVSRSGTTTETVEAVNAFRARNGGKVIAITCDDSTPLGEADVCLAAAEAQEESIAQTRSFTSMTVLAQALAGHLSGQDDFDMLKGLPRIAGRLLEDYHDLARDIGQDLEILLAKGSLICSVKGK